MPVLAGMLGKVALIGSLVANVYLLGAMLLFATVSYPQLGAVDRTSFPALYGSFTARIGLPVVSSEFLALVVVLALYAVRPPELPLWSVHLSVALGVMYFAITFGWHLPAHRALAAGDNSVSALAPLLTSQWARTVVQVVRVGLLAWLSVAKT